MLFLTAFLTGLFGSFHCAGMCGPIAFALPGKNTEGASYYIGRLLYNLGRLSSYGLLGSILGTFGLGLQLAGLQQGISIGVGILIILMVLYQQFFNKGISLNPFSFFSSGLIQKLFASKSKFSLYLIGVINGFLPCGFVYIALLGASATQGIWEGALFMVLFGLGTLPMMYGVSILGQFLSSSVRSKLNKLSPYFAVLIACLFILRGLNLGIPYVSPKIADDKQDIENCH
jgi:uncharacterized protein